MYRQLTREQRYAIYLGLQEKKSLTAIARQIGCSASTVSREVKRDSNRFGRYIFSQACELTEFRRERSGKNRRIPSQILKRVRKLLIEEDWSPQQISGYLRKERVFISHERIYQMIREDESGELRSHTRHKMKYRRRRKRTRKTKGSNIPNRISIHDRPAEADGARFGDWELDLIVGKGQRGALVTLTERSTNYILIAYTPNKKPQNIAGIVWRMLMPFKGNALKTITTDNGVEFAAHEKFGKRLNTTVYFADSYCSWQKGAIENANRLIRQYFPKGTDFSMITKAQILDVQKKLNNRPRAKLNFVSPKCVFYNLCM